MLCRLIRHSCIFTARMSPALSGSFCAIALQTLCEQVKLQNVRFLPGTASYVVKIFEHHSVSYFDCVT